MCFIPKAILGQTKLKQFHFLHLNGEASEIFSIESYFLAVEK